MSDNIIEITSSEQFKQEVSLFPWIALVDFWAEWCGPCRMVVPIMHELADDNASNPQVKILKVNVDQNPELAQAFQISSIPAVFILKEGQPVEIIVGANPKQVYQSKIDAQLATLWKEPEAETKIAA